MPFEIKNIDTQYYRGQENLNFDQITVDLDDKNNTAYIPQTVHKIYNTNVVDVSNFSSNVNVDQYVVLLEQDDRTENGLYKQLTGTSATILNNPTENTFFLDVSNEFKRAVYIKNIKNFFGVNFDKVLLGTSIQTTEDQSSISNRIFNYPIAYSKPSIINTFITGIASDNTLFNGQYKVIYYNKSGTSILKLDNFAKITHRSDTSLFNLPTISFGISMGTSGGTINLTSNNNKTVDWYINSEFIFN